MTLISLSNARNKRAVGTLTAFSKLIDRAIRSALNSSHVSGAEIAGILAHRSGAFLRLFRGDHHEMMKVMLEIMAREAARPIDVDETDPEV